jgi:threonyl-tRNA synthetase
LKRSHQCATIQLDFQLPIRFNLNFVSETGDKRRPVIIHRAILGSVERMIAILTENCAGKWPFWISPRQVMVVPVGPSLDAYANEVRDKLYEAGFMSESDTDAGDTMNKKIRNAQLAQFNFILVVGDKERQAGTVNVRTRDNKVHGEVTVEELIRKFGKLRADYAKDEDAF